MLDSERSNIMLKTSTESGVNLGSNGSLERFKHLKALGYDAVDYQPFCTEPGRGIFALNDKEFEAFLKQDAKYARENGLEIIQTHGLWPYDDTKPEQYDLKLEGMIRSIRGSAIVGAKYVVMHPVMPTGWAPSSHHDEDVAVNTEYFRKLVPYAKEYGIKIALENMPSYYVPCGCIKELVDCIDAIDSEYLVACLDTGHCNTSGIIGTPGEKIGDAIRMLGDRIGCLHIHDNDGRNDLHLAPFNGTVEWDSFIDALCEIRYNGVINFECHTPSAPDFLKAPAEKWIADAARYFAEEIYKKQAVIK